MKQKQKEKIRAKRDRRIFFSVKKFCYEVFAKQKKNELSRHTTHRALVVCRVGGGYEMGRGKERESGLVRMRMRPVKLLPVR